MKQCKICHGDGVCEWMTSPGEAVLCDCIKSKLTAADKLASAVSKLMAYRSFGVVVQPVEKAVFDAFAEYQST